VTRKPMGDGWWCANEGCLRFGHIDGCAVLSDQPCRATKRSGERRYRLMSGGDFTAVTGGADRRCHTERRHG
jgi:hypothetical protein